MRTKRELSADERTALLYRETVYQALRDLQLEGEANAAERELAKRFVLDDTDGMGSFRWCCAAAGLDAAAVRQELRDRGLCES